MAGRGRGRGRSRAAHVLDLRDQFPPLLERAPPTLHAHHPPLLGHAPPALHPHPAALHQPHLAALHQPHPPALIIDDPRRLLPHPIEDHLAAQHLDVQALLLDNQRLAATHVALMRELTAAQHELRLLSSSAATACAKSDAEVRDSLERAARAEAEARAVEGFRGELAQVRTDVQRLGASRDDLVKRLQGLKAELVRARAELGKASTVRAEIEAMHHEIQRGRAAVEYEKKMHANNLEQSQTMEKNMISMARDVEKLRAELANAERRTQAAAAVAANPGYPRAYGNSNMGYGGTYPEAYGMHEAQGSADGDVWYGARAASRGQFDIQHSHAHK